MEEWDAYAQKQKPSDSDTIMLKDTSGNVLKRTPFSSGWSWILDKLAS